MMGVLKIEIDGENENNVPYVSNLSAERAGFISHV